jgi:dihydroorotate dehydrogenase (fumarate)
MTGRDVEQRYLDILAAVKASVSIPVAVKIGPYFSAIGAMARALADAGAGALVLFNRFYQPDMDRIGGRGLQVFRSESAILVASQLANSIA